jgi:electron transfer flavoprotein alpha subunit
LAVLVFAELENGKVGRNAREVLGGARSVADKLKMEVLCCVLDGDGGQITEELGQAGADRVIVVKVATANPSDPESYLGALAETCAGIRPVLIIFAGTPVGRQLAPRVAHRLGYGIVTDCLSIEVSDDGQEILLTRPIYGGKVHAVFAAREGQVITMRPRALRPLEHPHRADPQVDYVEVTPRGGQPRTRVVEVQKETESGVRLEEAKVVVAGGRGIGGPEPFAMLEELAGLLGGAVGGSRAAVDAGWLPATRQIGLTGKIVSPDLYMAVAISGSSQHMAGVANSRVIVGINIDPEAPIFRSAHLGVVEDYREFVPVLIEKIKSAKVC